MADIPQRTAIRGVVPGTYDPMRRPGSSGQRYFSDVEYVTNVESPAAQTAANLAAQARRNEQAAGLQALNVSNLARQERPATFLPPAEEPAGIATVTPNQTSGVSRLYDILAQYLQGTQLQPYGTGETQMMAKGGEVQGDLPIMYDENSNPATADRNYDYITTKYNMGPMDPASEEGRREIKNMERKRRRESTRTPIEYLLDMLNTSKEGEELRLRNTSGDRRRFNERNPGFLRQLEDLKEARERILKAQDKGYAQGGLASIAPKGMYLGGPTDGMADEVPATIDNTQPAALSDGEFVIPADVVSHLGNGNSDAGAQQLYGMMERVRKARTGNPKQGREIDPNKYLA